MSTTKLEMSESARCQLRMGQVILRFLATPGETLNKEQEAAVETLGQAMYWCGRQDHERAMMAASTRPLEPELHPVTDPELGID